MPLYNAQYPPGTPVRIADRGALEEFRATWRYHNPLTIEQLEYASLVTKVASVSYYHGGDVLYELQGIPGLWHEEVLRDGDPRAV